jgi:hypothetical protein
MLATPFENLAMKESGVRCHWCRDKMFYVPFATGLPILFCKKCDDPYPKKEASK